MQKNPNNQEEIFDLVYPVMEILQRTSKEGDMYHALSGRLKEALTLLDKERLEDSVEWINTFTRPSTEPEASETFYEVDAYCPGCFGVQIWRFEEETKFTDDCMYCGAVYTKDEFAKHYDHDIFQPTKDEVFVLHCPKSQYE